MDTELLARARSREIEREVARLHLLGEAKSAGSPDKRPAVVDGRRPLAQRVVRVFGLSWRTVSRMAATSGVQQGGGTA